MSKEEKAASADRRVWHMTPDDFKRDMSTVDADSLQVICDFINFHKLLPTFRDFVFNYDKKEEHSPWWAEKKIIVNGKEKIVNKVTLNYHEIISLAYDDPALLTDSLTVTYSYISNGKVKCCDAQHSGSISCRDSISVHEGMIIDVADTRSA